MRRDVAEESAVQERDAAALLLLAPATLILLLWIVSDGSWEVTAWVPGGLFLLLLLVVRTLTAPSWWTTVPRPLLVAVGALAGYAAWSLASISWSDARGDAWDGANRTIVYVIVLTLYASCRCSPRVVALLLGAFAIGTAAIGTATLARAAAAAVPETFLLNGRLAEPVSYANANAAVFAIGFFIAFALAMQREARPAVRALLYAAAGVLVELAILCQSRGWLLGFVGTSALFLLVTRTRLRTIAFAVPLLAVVSASLPMLLDVYAAAEEGRAAVATSIDAALAAVGISAVVLAAIGLATALLDNRLELSQDALRVAGAVTLAVAAVGAGVAAASLFPDDPAGRLSTEWDRFTAPPPEVWHLEDGSSHFFSDAVSGNRYDVWRVAVSEFASAPIRGIGADNFAVPYLEQRRSLEEPLYPHSFELRVLTGTGLIGAAFVIVFLGTLTWAFLASAPDRRQRERSVAVACGLPLLYWGLHGSVDWLWEVPAVTGSVLAAAALGAGIARQGSEPSRVDRRGGGAVVASALVLLATGAAVSLAPPWLAARDVQQAASSWRSDPAAAADRLERARGLNPLSERADLVAGAIHRRLGNITAARTAFRRALDRAPTSWYAALELAVVELEAGRRRAARASLDHARRLNPREPTLDLVEEAIASGKPLGAEGLDEHFLYRSAAREKGLRGLLD